MDEEKLSHYTKDTNSFAHFYAFIELTKDPWRNKLDNNAIVLYQKLLYLCNLSVQNKWLNDKGYCYVKMSNEKIAQVLNVSKNTATKVKQQLLDAGLIEIPDAEKVKKNRHSYPIYVNVIKNTEKIVSIDNKKNGKTKNNMLRTDYNFEEIEKNCLEN